MAAAPSSYRSLVGGLKYLTLPRLDIAYAVNLVSQFMHCPHPSHLQAVKRILSYLKDTMVFFFSFFFEPLLVFSSALFYLIGRSTYLPEFIPMKISRHRYISRGYRVLSL